MEKGNRFELSSILSFIIALLIVSCIFYFVYIKFIKINKPESNNYNVNSIIDDDDIDALGKEKYAWLSSQKNVIDDSLVFFKDKSVYLNTINFQDVLMIAYRMADTNDRNPNSSCNDAECVYETFSKNVLKEQVDKSFSSKLNINFKDFRATGSLLCTLNSDTYSCKKDDAELKIDPLFIIPGYLYSRINGGKLVVYSTFISVKREMDIYSKDEQGIYGGTNLSNKIDDLSFYNEFKDNLTNDNMQKIVDKYKDKLPIYKSTFVLENNNYVWEKTEIDK